MTSSDIHHVIDTCLAIFSHEVRSPLSTILGWSQILSTKQLTPDQLHVACRAIERSAHDITALVNEVGYLRSIVRSEREHSTAPFEASSVIHLAVEALSAFAEERRVSVRLVDTTEGVTFPLLDKQIVMATVTSLIAHAIRMTGPRGEVTVVAAPRGESLEVSVEALRGEEGLHLAIAKSLSELCGGSLSTEDRGRGKPALLTVALPIKGASSSAKAMGF